MIHNILFSDKQTMIPTTTSMPKITSMLLTRKIPTTGMLKERPIRMIKYQGNSYSFSQPSISKYLCQWNDEHVNVNNSVYYLVSSPKSLMDTSF